MVKFASMVSVTVNSSSSWLLSFSSNESLAVQNRVTTSPADRWTTQWGETLSSCYVHAHWRVTAGEVPQ